jgi:hypothetical protein
VHAQDSILYECRNGHIIEHLDECLPKLRLVAPLALIKEAIDARNVLALVVASKEEHALRVLYFEREKQTQCFYALIAAIHVVAKEQVVRLWRHSNIIHETKQIVVLAVNIGAYNERRLQSQQHGLIFDDLADALYQRIDLGLQVEAHHGTRSLETYAHELRDYRVDVKVVFLDWLDLHWHGHGFEHVEINFFSGWLFRFFLFFLLFYAFVARRRFVIRFAIRRARRTRPILLLIALLVRLDLFLGFGLNFTLRVSRGVKVYRLILRAIIICCRSLIS